MGWTVAKLSKTLPVDAGAIDQTSVFQEELSADRIQGGEHIDEQSRGVKRAVAVSQSPRIGSAAADWSRWPMGTTFRLLSTGQIYRVEDYGWALSGRNTIDLYMINQREMNSWGARQEPIQVLRWGEPQQSLQFLQSHQDYKHIKRMVLELEGRDQEAAALR